jgi:hypothetical protein
MEESQSLMPFFCFVMKKMTRMDNKLSKKDIFSLIKKITICVLNPDLGLETENSPAQGVDSLNSAPARAEPSGGG